MKKILLIIAIALCIFQMVVLATAIDIGSAATNRNSAIEYSTLVNKDNPANETGTITTIEIWADTQMANCEVATFFVVSGNNLSTRDYETLNNGNGAGVVLAGSKQTFTVNLDVQSGDYIGLYFSSGGKIERLWGTGAGYWQHYQTDSIPCTNVAFSFVSGHTMSLYGTGATGEEEDNAIFFGFNF